MRSPNLVQGHNTVSRARVRASACALGTIISEFFPRLYPYMPPKRPLSRSDGVVGSRQDEDRSIATQKPSQTCERGPLCPELASVQRSELVRPESTLRLRREIGNGFHALNRVGKAVPVLSPAHHREVGMQHFRFRGRASKPLACILCCGHGVLSRGSKETGRADSFIVGSQSKRERA